MGDAEVEPRLRLRAPSSLTASRSSRPASAVQRPTLKSTLKSTLHSSLKPTRSRTHTDAHTDTHTGTHTDTNTGIDTDPMSRRRRERAVFRPQDAVQQQVECLCVSFSVPHTCTRTHTLGYVLKSRLGVAFAFVASFTGMHCFLDWMQRREEALRELVRQLALHHATLPRAHVYASVAKVDQFSFSIFLSVIRNSNRRKKNQRLFFCLLLSDRTSR